MPHAHVWVETGVKAHECVEIFHPSPQDFNWIQQVPVFDKAKAHTVPELVALLQPNVKLKLPAATEMKSPILKGCCRFENILSDATLLVQFSPDILKLPNWMRACPLIEFCCYPLKV
jgi:hypothetical protein